MIFFYKGTVIWENIIKRELWYPHYGKWCDVKESQDGCGEGEERGFEVAGFFDLVIL